MGVSSGFAIAVLITPAIPYLFLGGQGWVVGVHPDVYKVVADSPKGSMVASLAREVNDNIPAFSERSVLVGREFALPYHVDFYDEMRQRALDLVAAQYSEELSVIQSFVEQYGVDIWIVAKDFSDAGYLYKQNWLVNSALQETVEMTDKRLKKGTEPALIALIPTCTIHEERDLFVLSADCITGFSD